MIKSLPCKVNPKHDLDCFLKKKKKNPITYRTVI